MSIQFPPFMEFLNCFSLSEKERIIKGINIENELPKMKEQLLHKTLFLREEDKRYIGESHLRLINAKLKNLASHKRYEREVLEELRIYISVVYGTNKRKEKDEKIPEIFRSRIAFDFFLETLYEFNALDQNKQLVEPYMPVIDAIRKSKPYKEKILKNNVGLKPYILYLNSYFGVEMNPSKISSGEKLVNEISSFLERNFSSE